MVIQKVKKLQKLISEVRKKTRQNRKKTKGVHRHALSPVHFLGFKNKEGFFGVFCYINKVHFVEALTMLTSAE